MSIPQSPLGGGQFQTQTKKAVLVFVKYMASPLVLYVDNADEFYTEMVELVKNAKESKPKLIEKRGNGPIKKFAALDTQIIGVSIQEETHVNY